MNPKLSEPISFKIWNESWEILDLSDNNLTSTEAFNITAHNAKGDEIGHAEIYHDHKTNQMMVSNVLVDSNYQRQGIATALYVLAEKISKKKLSPYPQQYDEGKHLWAQPNRPFG
jgi:ribosomal protein S18 acetylase RimI-like enzyme